MTGKIRGSLTVFLSLTMLFFLTFCLVLVEGSRLYYLRARSALAMDLAEFSVLSEYQYELCSHYGVFFLDLDYEQGREQMAVLEQKVNTYLMKMHRSFQPQVFLQMIFGGLRIKADYRFFIRRWH